MLAARVTHLGVVRVTHLGVVRVGEMSLFDQDEAARGTAGEREQAKMDLGDGRETAPGPIGRPMPE